MTTAPLTPGVHTVIIDARLVWAGEPLFHVPEGTVVLGVTPLAPRPDGYVEFRVRVGVKKLKHNDLDTTQHP